jgi:hypothetical protein
MQKPTVYIAGKVTGLAIDQVWNRFEKKEFELMKRGYEVFNPVRMVGDLLMGREDTWENIMRYCLLTMLTCDEVYMLNDWKKSEGAKLEHHVAEQLQFTITYESECSTQETVRVLKQPQ